MSFATRLCVPALSDSDAPEEGLGVGAVMDGIGGDLDALAAAVASIDNGAATLNLIERLPFAVRFGEPEAFGPIGQDLDTLTARVAALDGGTSSYDFASRLPFAIGRSSLLEEVGADLDTLAARIGVLSAPAAPFELSLFDLSDFRNLLGL